MKTLALALSFFLLASAPQVFAYDEVVEYQEEGSTQENIQATGRSVGRGAQNPGSVVDYFATLYTFDAIQEQYRRERGATPSNPLAFNNYVDSNNEVESNESQVIVREVDSYDEVIIYNEDSALNRNTQGDIVRYNGGNVYTTASVFDTNSASFINGGGLFLFLLVLLVFIVVLRFTIKNRRVQKARMQGVDRFHDPLRYHPQGR